MTFIEALNEFIFGRQVLSEISYESGWLIFIVSSALFGLAFILLHFIAIRLFNSKLFKVNDQAHFLEVIVFWTIASTIVSFIGYSLGMIGETVQSCAAVGVSWMYIASDIVKKISAPKEKQE